ncbi:MAG: T9SS type A sorting domain-containing protein [Bacteroidia bacterium]|nr:T9SS type A sorting domain-containing protein [Bacteroidia bacterium]
MKHIKLIVIVIIAFVGGQNPCFPQYNEGDTLQFWSVTYIDWPPLQGSPQRVVNAVCKKAGTHCYVFVEDAATQPLQSDIDSLVHMFDCHFYDSLTSHYGPVPDVFDNDSDVFILVISESNWSGYFDPGQQMPDSMVYARWNRHSSQREIIYVAAEYFIYDFVGTVAHEFGHLLHWQQDHSPDPIINPVKYWEDAWVDEGFSTFAAIYLMENIYRHNLLDNGAFFSGNPDIPLIYFSDYNQVKLFTLFMFERFGKWNYISALIGNQLNGISGVDSALNGLGYAESFDDAFEQWVIANCADDSVYAGGKYSYTHYRFSGCHMSATYTPLPNGLKNATVTPYGSDYIRFISSVPNPIVIDFTGQPGSKFRLDFILKNNANNHIDSIIGVPLDSLNHAAFIANDLGTIYNTVVMVVMNVDSAIHENSVASYAYSAASYTGIEKSALKNKIVVFPNPVKDRLFIVSSDNLHSLLEINDVQGIVHFSKNFINTATLDISGLAKGIYWLRIINNKDTVTEKIIKE